MCLMQPAEISPCIGFNVNDSIVCESKHDVVVSLGSVSKFCFSSPNDIFESKKSDKLSRSCEHHKRREITLQRRMI